MNQTKPLVSIVITNYNYGLYLEDAIESALHQTYRPLEVLVVDDGSTDNSVEIIQKYPAKLISREHKGIAAAVDAGVRASRGDYYVPLSADDILHPEYVMKTLSVLMGNAGAAFVYTAAFMFGATSRILMPKEYSLAELLKANYIPATALVRTQIYHIAGGYDPELPVWEDWDHWLAFAEYGFYGVLLPKPLFYWRRHAAHSRNIQPVRVIKKAFGRIRQKHQRLWPWYFPIIDIYDRGILQASYLKERLLETHPSLAIRLSALVGKVVPKRGARLIAVLPELSSPTFDFLSERCCRNRPTRESLT